MKRVLFVNAIWVATFMIPIAMYVYLMLFRPLNARDYGSKSTLLTPVIVFLMVGVIVCAGVTFVEFQIIDVK